MSPSTRSAPRRKDLRDVGSPHAPTRVRPPRPGRRGLSLLEVVLAIVVLAMSVIAIGQLLSIGAQQSLVMVEQSRAQQYAQSLLDAVAAGAVPLQSIGWTPVASDPEWEYALDVVSNTLDGLKSVQARVQLAQQSTLASSASAQGNGPDSKPSTVVLHRWILDPAFVQQRVQDAILADETVIDEMIAAQAELEATESEASGPSSSGSTGSPSSGSGGVGGER